MKEHEILFIHLSIFLITLSIEVNFITALKNRYFFFVKDSYYFIGIKIRKRY